MHRRLSAPPRADRLAREHARRRRRPWRELGGGIDPDARVGACAPPSARSSASPGRSPSRPTCWCSTSRPRPCRRPTSPGCWRRCAGLRGRGLAILYVTHRLDEVFRIADRVTVLRDGRRVGCEAGRRHDPGPAGRADRRPQPGGAVPHAAAAPRRATPAPGRRARDRRRRAGLASPCTPARSSALSACAAPATTPSGALSSATSRRRDGQRRASPAARWPPRSPADGGGPGVGFVSSKRGEESLAPNLAVRENLFMNPAAGRRPRTASAAAGERSRAASSACRALRRAAGRARACRSSTSRAATSRRWSSPAGSRRGARLLGPRGADLRRRCRGQGRDLPAARPAVERGPRRAADLVRLRGGGRHRASGTGLRPRPDHRRGAAATSSPCRGSPAHRRRGAGAEPPHERAFRPPAPSLGLAPADPAAASWSSSSRCSSPTPSSTAFTFRSMANSRSINALVALAVMIPLAANQFDLSAASIARHRPGAGQRPADPAGSALAAGLRHRAHGRSVGLVNGTAGHPGPDQLLHRHARHRHAAAGPEPVVHRRPPGRGPAARGFTGLSASRARHRRPGAAALRAR